MPMDGLENILRPYQMVGTAWMLHLFDHGLGGILADEMGLGKTLQTLAFLSCLRQRGGPSKTSLVICPASLIENWKRKPNDFVHPSWFIPIMDQTVQPRPPTSESLIWLSLPMAPLPGINVYRLSLPLRDWG